jgi:hypothetical protein
MSTAKSVETCMPNTSMRDSDGMQVRTCVHCLFSCTLWMQIRYTGVIGGPSHRFFSVKPCASSDGTRMSWTGFNDGWRLLSCPPTFHCILHSDCSSRSNGAEGTVSCKVETVTVQYALVVQQHTFPNCKSAVLCSHTVLKLFYILLLNKNFDWNDYARQFTVHYRIQSKHQEGGNVS